ncbi:MAG: arylsulfatase [Lautropia sp.]
MADTPPPTFIGRTLDESVIPPVAAVTRRRRPNIVLWMMDDVGFGNLGPYGGLVEMPALQRLVDRGMRFTNAHVTPLCTTTRACVLTGRNHHSSHMPAIPRFSSGLAAHDTRIPREHGFLSQMLVEHGYATLCLGKWHLTSLADLNPAAPRDAWPLGRGFERFYGFMAGQTSQFDPHLCVDNGALYPPRTTGGDYHLSADLVDTGMRYVKELRSGDLDKPFFMYLAFGASHAPHHAPQAWIDRYRGRFDMGWDRYREIVHERQQQMGIVRPGSPLSQRDPDVPAWSDASVEQRAVHARFMEAFAGMTAHMDHQVGRLLDQLEAMGELDDTIVIAMSDNGASSEGGIAGAYNNQHFQGKIDQVSATLDNLDAIGGPDAYNHYPWGWAWAGNTPFRRWKRETYRGGCAVPFVVSWPGGLAERHGNRDGFVHAIDVVPTVLELLALDAPATLAGVAQAPLHGTSFRAQLLDPAVPSRHRVQYYEIMGHRSLHCDGWRAVCPWPGPSWKEAGRPWPSDLLAADLERLEERGWELYDVRTDPAETHDLATTEPERLRAMVAWWWHEAGRYGVLPLAGKPPAAPKGPDQPVRLHRFYPDTAPVFIEAAPDIINANYRISADLEVGAQPAEGMILAHGGKFGGYALFFIEGRPQFLYNYLGLRETIVSASDPLAPGRHRISVVFRKQGAPEFAQGRGAPGIVQLLADGTVLAEGRIDPTAPVMLNFSGTLTCGYHHMEPFNDSYTAPFRFNGTIHEVAVATHGERVLDAALAQEVFMKRQ